MAPRLIALAMTAVAVSAGSCVGTDYDFLLLVTQWDITG